MQPRGAQSSFGNLKEEPLRASWPAMLVDPSWYVLSIACFTMKKPGWTLFSVISIRQLALLQHISNGNHRIIYVKVISFILLLHSMIEVANQLKSNERHSSVLSKKTW